MRRSQSSDAPSADAAGARPTKKEALAERVEKASRVWVLEAIRKKLADTLSGPDLEMVVLDYFPALGHDHRRRLSKLYAWKEKKSKISWGAQTVDHETITAAAIQALKAAGLNRHLAREKRLPLLTEGRGAILGYRGHK